MKARPPRKQKPGKATDKKQKAAPRPVKLVAAPPPRPYRPPAGDLAAERAFMDW